MADRDWINYKSLRGKELPQEAAWLGRSWKLVRLLKRDFYAVSGLYESTDDQPVTQVLLKVYNTDPLGPFRLDWLGRRHARRETRVLQAVADIEGMPRLLDIVGETAHIRVFEPGCNLREHGKWKGLRDDFFPRLKKALAELHAREIAHNDLSKPENVLVTDDGSPVLIDFQIAWKLPGSGIWRRLLGGLHRYLQGVDRYHLMKLHRRYRSTDFTPEELTAARKKHWMVHVHGVLRRPYRKVRHFVLDKYMKADAIEKAA